MTVFVKELKVLWASPVPYVLGAVFHATLGVLGWSQITSRGQAVFQPLVPIAGLLILLIAPILTSRSFSEEIRTGTLDVLLAVPVRSGRLVAGKYASVLVSLWALLAPTVLFAVLLAMWGDPDPGVVASGMVGLALLAGLVAAVGIVTSSLTASQPVAAVSGVFAVLVLWFAHTGSEALAAGAFLGAFSISERLRSFAGGVIDPGDIVFFVSAAIVLCLAAATAVERRRAR